MKALTSKVLLLQRDLQKGDFTLCVYVGLVVLVKMTYFQQYVMNEIYKSFEGTSMNLTRDFLIHKKNVFLATFIFYEIKQLTDITYSFQKINMYKCGVLATTQYFILK